MNLLENLDADVVVARKEVLAYVQGHRFDLEGLSYNCWGVVRSVEDFWLRVR